MNENINLNEILKDVEIGTELYSPIFGYVKLHEIIPTAIDSIICIAIGDDEEHYVVNFTKEGHYINFFDNTECILFPSKEQRDWSKFKSDLPINTPVMVKNDGTSWFLRFYSGNKHCYIGGELSTNKLPTEYWKYIIPYDKFNPYNIKESLKYNIVNN